MSKHIIEALGKTRIVIENGEVTKIGKSKIEECPIFKKYRNVDGFTYESIKKNIEYRINKFGMCTENRVTRMGDFLSFGVSEILSLALKEKLIDAAVIAADGCGTVILDDPEVVQGMGGRISGIIETEPIQKVINDIGPERLLDPNTARIDMFEGVSKAFAMHYNTVAVTITSTVDAQKIRDHFKKDVIIVAVHTTGVTKEEAEMLYNFCDIITACASKPIRELAQKNAIMQAGKKIPIYATSEKGAVLIQAKLRELGMEPSSTLENGPVPLI